MFVIWFQSFQVSLNVYVVIPKYIFVERKSNTDKLMDIIGGQQNAIMERLEKLTQ